MSQIEDRLEEIAKFTRREEDVLALRDHLREVLNSPSFSSSRRSGQFLQYVVEQALQQHNDALKERSIGMEVFQRPPDYDTGEDAIVRVTASDVRRRLAQHYRELGRSAVFRINLPPGGYVPEIECVGSSNEEATQPRKPGESEPEVRAEALISAAATSQSLPASNPHPRYSTTVQKNPGRQRWHSWPLLLTVCGLLTVILSAVTVLWIHSRRVPDESVLQPWAKLFRGGQTVSVVLADPDLNEIQLLTNQYVPLSDYANGRLGCESLSPELQRVCRRSLRGDKVAEVDANAVVRIAQIGAQFHSQVEPHAARSLRLPDLQGDRNFVILGSKVSNPWADLYHDRMNFFIDHDAATGLQVVRNQHPRKDELATYVPTAGPYDTGDNYALITLIRNLHGNGYVLLLAGCTHEGMDAAMAVLLNHPEFSRMLRACHLSEESPFQVLMRVHMMAGSSLTAERLACRQLE